MSHSCAGCGKAFNTPLQLRAHTQLCSRSSPCTAPAPGLALRDSRYGKETVATQDFGVGAVVLLDELLMDFGAVPTTERTQLLRALFDEHCPVGVPKEHVRR